MRSRSNLTKARFRLLDFYNAVLDSHRGDYTPGEVLMASFGVKADALNRGRMRVLL